MNNESLEGCPRCSDYDEVVEELKKEKDTREQKAKSELHKCEERHKKKDAKIKGLEKKILTMTIIAVVAGTILGKDFIDEIASYFKSFNSVTDSASKLIGSASTNTNENADEVAKQDNTEEIEDIDDIFVLELAPRTFDMGEWPALIAQVDMISSRLDSLSLSHLPYTNLSPLDETIMKPTNLTNMLLEDILNDTMAINEDTMLVSSASIINELTAFGVGGGFVEEIRNPIYYSQGTYVPESSSLLLMGLPLCIGCRRRR